MIKDQDQTQMIILVIAIVENVFQLSITVDSQKIVYNKFCGFTEN